LCAPASQRRWRAIAPPLGRRATVAYTSIFAKQRQTFLTRWKRSGATADLTEALEIAESGRMRLHACDTHLEWARLCRDQGDFAEARRHLARARDLVDQTGYKRREREVAWLEKELAKESTMKDFFVSFNSADKAWADWISWTLEEGGYQVVYQNWDFRPGGNFVLEM
jgi:hypothetical protein